jgi:AbrB family looped-hinge helix DNA binding protein
LWLLLSGIPAIDLLPSAAPGNGARLRHSHGCIRATHPGWRGLAPIDIAYDGPAMEVTTVSPKFQVVIPGRVREQFGLRPGQTIQVIALPGRIELVPTQSPAALRGFLPGKNTFAREADRL